VKGSALLKRTAAAVLVTAAVAFLGYRIYTNWAGIRAYPWHVNPLLLAASLAAHVAVLVSGTFVWSRVVACFDHPPVPARDLLRVWALSNLARYIPGSVFQFVAAAHLAGQRGLSRVLLLASLAVHVGMTLVAAAVLGVATLPLSSLGVQAPPRWMVWLLPLSVVFVHPAVLNGALRLLSRVTRRPALVWRGSWAAGIGLLALDVASWIVYGLAFWLFLRSLAALPASTIGPVIGVNAFSFIAGYVTPAPGGIGPREAMMTLLLTPFYPAGVAAAVATLARLWSIAAELGTAAVALLLPGGRDASAVGVDEVAEAVPEDAPRP
jgi:uncharacterized membrane protein YbhN (UPF0104 family)